jgi:hypothetical protein
MTLPYLSPASWCKFLNITSVYRTFLQINVSNDLSTLICKLNRYRKLGAEDTYLTGIKVTGRVENASEAIRKVVMMELTADI